MLKVNQECLISALHGYARYTKIWHWLLTIIKHLLRDQQQQLRRLLYSPYTKEATFAILKNNNFHYYMNLNHQKNISVYLKNLNLRKNADTVFQFLESLHQEKVVPLVTLPMVTLPMVTLPMVTLPMVTLPLVKADSQGLWQTFAAENYKKSYLSVEM